MNLVINSYVSVGDMSFESSKKEIREKYPSFEEVDKDVTKGTKETSDMYSRFFVYYDEFEKPKAFEFFGDFNVLFKEHSLLNKPYKEIRAFFLSIDENLILDDSGLTSLKYGIGIYCSDAYVIEDNMTLEEMIEEGVEEEPKTETVIVFRKNYYDGIY